MRRIRPVLGPFLLWALAFPLGAQPLGNLQLGFQADGWTLNTAESFGGHEFLIPLSVDLRLDRGLSLYGESAFAAGSYTDSVAGTETLDLTALTDSVVGTQVRFQSFGLPALVDFALNLPTGDPSWEVKQSASNIPTQFLGTRYLGRGFGLSAVYGLDLSGGPGGPGTAQWGVAAGYYHSGALNPDYGSVPSSEKLGDSFFLALSRVEDRGEGKTAAWRLSGFLFLASQISGADAFRMGPNLNASYASSDPKGFSWELGGQFFLPADRPGTDGALAAEPHDSFGQRFYWAPSLALGDWSFAGMVKYITPNGYSTADALYNGGGFLFGLTPDWRMGLDPRSHLDLSAGYDFIIAQNADATHALDVDYGYWTAGLAYTLDL